jgi:hypothetical protein
MKNYVSKVAACSSAGIEQVSANRRIDIRRRKIIKFALMVLVALGFAHIVLGSYPIVPVLAVLTMMLALWPLARYGEMNIAALLIILLAFRHVGFPLIMKLFMGQALDTNLDHPTTAYAIVLLGVSGYVGAFFFANHINVGVPILKPLREPHVLLRFSCLAFAVGVIANIDTAIRAYVDESDALTISGFFTSILHLALITALAEMLLINNGRRILNFWVLIILAIEVAFSFAMNSRASLFEAFLCVLMTAFSFRGYITKTQVAGLLSMLLLVIVLTPGFLYVRDVREDLAFGQRISATFEAIMNGEDAQANYEYYRDLQLSSANYRLNYYGSPNNVFERFSLINHMDIIIHGVGDQEPLGFDMFTLAFERALPRFLAPDKSRLFSEGDWLYCELGMGCSLGGFSTVPLIGVSYASFGWSGVVAIPFMFALLVFLLIKKVMGLSLTNNVGAIYIITAMNNQFVEGGAAQYMVMLFRQIPQDTSVMLVLAIIAGLKFIPHK